MEFKFRATDDRSSAPSSSSTFAPVHGTFFCNAVERNISSDTKAKNPMEVGRFREDLMMEEIARRRELEEEVRREMMVRREMDFTRTIRGGGAGFYSHSLPVWVPHLGYHDGFRVTERMAGLSGNFPFRPENRDQESLTLMRQFCTSPFPGRREVNGGETLALTRRSKSGPIIEHLSDDGPQPKGEMLKSVHSNAVGEKRKVESPMVADSDGTHSSTGKKKTKKEWRCTVCQVTATCERQLEDHFKGKKHKAKAAKLKSSESQGKKDNGGSTRVYKNQKHHKFWCNMCKIGTTSEALMVKHRNGKKHMNLLQINGGAVIVVSTLVEDVQEFKTTTNEEIDDSAEHAEDLKEGDGQIEQEQS